MKKITLLIFLISITFNSYAQLSEDFETDPPTGWTFMQTETDDPGWVQTTSRANTGSYSFYHNDDNVASESTSWMISPAYTVSSGEELSFYYNNNYNTYSVESGMWISTASGDPIANPSDFSEVFDIDANYSEDVWTTHVHDLSSYVGQTIYVAFKYRGDYADEVYIDDFSIYTPSLAPNCVTNLSPVQDATSVNNNGRQVILSWDAPSVDDNHDAHTSYEIMFGTTSGDLTSVGSVAPAATSVTITGVDYDTTYYWMVVPTNTGGGASGCSEYSFTTAASAQVPYSNNFTSFPSDWTEASGDYGTPSGTTGSFAQDDFINDTSHENGKSARINIYGSSTDEYFISPLLDLSGGTYYLNYDIGLTTYAGTSSATLGADDYLALLVTQDGGSSWQELYRWDASTAISNEGQSATEITLSNYGTEVQFAFYAFSDTSNVDNDLFIDNFQITSETLGTATNTLEGFTLYPTIVKEELNFRSQNNVEAITVFNLLGQKVFSGAPNTNNSSINLSNLRPGVYVVKVSAEGKIGSYKIIKE